MQRKRIAPKITHTTTAVGEEAPKELNLPPPPPLPQQAVTIESDPFVCSANESIWMRFVSDASEIDAQQQQQPPPPTGERAFFHPTFTHQVISEDQQIRGYNGLRVDFWFSCTSMKSFVQSHWTQTAPQGRQIDTDPALVIYNKMPEHSKPSRTIEDFKHVVSEDNKSTFTPPGEIVWTYGPLENGDHLEVRLADISNGDLDGKARTFHERIQMFVLWLIDGGSLIDSSELGWRAFFLFRRDSHGKRCSLLGYTTAFFFYHYPDSTRIRISQVIIFPPFQRHGYGLRMIEAIYKYARDNPKVADVTVEDPSEEFRPLRDLVDLQILCEMKLFQEEEEEQQPSSSAPALTKEKIEEARKRTKICRQQLIKCNEVFEFERARNSGDSNAMQRFRLKIKAQISVEYCDWLQDCKTIEERKQVLDEIYREHEKDYTELLLALHKNH